MKLLIGIVVFLIGSLPFFALDVNMQLKRSLTIDSLGACQGITYKNGKVYLYGDREVGVIREYLLEEDTLKYTNHEIRLTMDGKDVINHPTGIAHNGIAPTFIGNSVRLNEEGTAWKALIYCINWEGLLNKGTLDGNVFNVIEDDACIQGTRPEYVKYKDKWYVATSDYGNKANEVRLYDPEFLKKASKTSEKGVLFKKFTCAPWVQNIHWIPEKDMLVLIQNQIEGRKWRFTYLNLKKSIESGTQDVSKVIDIDKADELEGFSFLNTSATGIAVTSSRKENVNFIGINW